MLNLIAALTLLALEGAGLPLLLYSNTSLPLFAALQPHLPMSLATLMVAEDSALQEYIDAWQVSTIIDLTASAAVSMHVGQQVAHFHIPLYVLRDGKLVGSPHSSKLPLREAEICVQVALAFSWLKFNIVTTNSDDSIATAKSIRERLRNSEVFTIAEDATSEQIHSFVGRLIKPRGCQYFILLTPTPLSQSLLHAAKSKRLYEPGNLYILGTENDQFSSTFLQALGGGLLLLSQYMRVPVDVADRTLLAISAILEGRLDSYYVFNTQSSGEYLKAGKCDKECQLSGALSFPGESSEIPAEEESHVLMSLPTNYTDSNEAVMVVHVYGAVVAIEEINHRSDILPNFRFQHQTFYFGILEFKLDLALQNAARLDYKLGSVVASGIENSGIAAMFSIFHQMNKTFPIIGSESPYSGFSNTTEFPFFVRTIVSDTYTARTYAQIMQLFGWKRCALLFESGLGFSAFVSVFEHSALLSHIEIVNSKRQIPDDFTTQPLDAYLPLLAEIIHTRARVIIVISITRSTIERIVTLLHRAGARKGDIVIVAVAWLIDGIWELMRGDSYEIYAELMPGAIIAFPMTFIGREGARVRGDLEQRFQVDPPAGMCLYYDSAMLVGRALDFLITNGEDPEDPFKVNAALRTTKFVGCSGTVSIDSASNDRSQMDFVVQNLKYFPENDTWRLDNVLRFSPTSAVVLTRLGNFTWPDGSATTPTDTFHFDIDCPFHSRELRPSNVGRVIMMTVAYSVAIAAGVATFAIWRKWWLQGVPELKEKCEICVNDVVALTTIVVEFFQYLSMGPESDSLITAIHTISESVSFDFQKIMELQNGIFWILMDAVLFGCVLWTLSLLMIFCDLWTRLRFICMVETLEQVADTTLPLLGNVCFLPIISTLVEVFMCDNAVGSALTDTVLSKDCYQRCWVFPHYLYVAGAVVALMVYVPTAVFCRPLWQEFQSVHVKSLPSFLMLKTVFQVLLIVLNKTIKRIWPLAHSVVFTLVAAVFSGVTLWKRPFNYSRPNLWQFMLLLMVAWYGVNATLSQHFESEAGTLVIVLLTGWAGMGIVGLVVQIKRCPSKLYRKKGRDIAVLFKFQLSKSSVDPKTISPSLNKVAPTKSIDTVF